MAIVEIEIRAGYKGRLWSKCHECLEWVRVHDNLADAQRAAENHRATEHTGRSIKFTYTNKESGENDMAPKTTADGLIDALEHGQEPLPGELIALRRFASVGARILTAFHFDDKGTQAADISEVIGDIYARSRLEISDEEYLKIGKSLGVEPEDYGYTPPVLKFRDDVDGADKIELEEAYRTYTADEERDRDQQDANAYDLIQKLMKYAGIEKA